MELDSLTKEELRNLLREERDAIAHDLSKILVTFLDDSLFRDVDGVPGTLQKKYDLSDEDVFCVYLLEVAQLIHDGEEFGVIVANLEGKDTPIIFNVGEIRNSYNYIINKKNVLDYVNLLKSALPMENISGIARLIDTSDFVLTEDLTRSAKIKDMLTEENLAVTTPYMLRVDGKLLSCGEAHPYIKYYFDYSDRANLDNLIENHPESLEWYYKNSLSDLTCKLIDNLRADPTDVESYNRLNDLCNKEFCKVRTSNMRYKYGGDNGEIYFRLCSDKVNWFPLIWDTIALYAPDTKYITIVWDYQTFGKQYDYCKLNRQEMRHIPADEFLTLPGDPIIERRK